MYTHTDTHTHTLDLGAFKDWMWCAATDKSTLTCPAGGGFNSTLCVFVVCVCLCVDLHIDIPISYVICKCTQLNFYVVCKCTYICDMQMYVPGRRATPRRVCGRERKSFHAELFFYLRGHFGVGGLDDIGLFFSGMFLGQLVLRVWAATLGWGLRTVRSAFFFWKKRKKDSTYRGRHGRDDSLNSHHRPHPVWGTGVDVHRCRTFKDVRKRCYWGGHCARTSPEV